jgi:hypothetical protein
MARKSCGQNKGMSMRFLPIIAFGVFLSFSCNKECTNSVTATCKETVPKVNYVKLLSKGGFTMQIRINVKRKLTVDVLKRVLHRRANVKLVNAIIKT